MNSSSNTNISSKYNLPKFRISSADINSTSLDGFNRDRDVSRTSQRTLSASTVVSTPSNRRRIKNKLVNKSINSKIPNQKLSKSKILNLQQSKIKFNLNHDWDLNKLQGSNYDYSVFTSYPPDSIPPTIKQSQINAWESAENITRNLIFNESDDDDEPEEEEEEYDITNVIKSIPGYSPGELQIMLNAVNQKIPPKQEKSQLYDYKYNLQINQQNQFNQAATFQLKRQVQINQKKALLRTMFDHSNNLNVNYITNNTNYSAIDNSINIQKTFHEDKDEISLLMQQRINFEKSLLDINHKPTNENRKTSKKNDTDDSNLLKINLSSAQNLLKYYYNYLNECDDDLNNSLLKDDIAPLLLNQLRLNVRHDDNS